ncbi:MAG: KOW domain-containing RNA-binding protein [Clostridiales bacterium]|nr:KOW domain-containing RNA-binding protein [Clostridiales bacterium]
MFSIGQTVYSKSGRDKGEAFIVVGIEGEYLFLADGKRRRLEKPKKKKQIHVQKVNRIDEDIKNKIENNLYLLDSDLRSSLKKFKENGKEAG